MKNFEVTSSNDELGMAIIRITEPKFLDALISFGKLSIREIEGSEDAFLDFTYNVIEDTSAEIREIIKDNIEEFEDIVGNILLTIIKDQIEVEKSNKEWQE